VIHREGSEATLIEWHPVHTMLASGWADGTVCLWTEKERVLRFAYHHRLCLSVCLSVCLSTIGRYSTLYMLLTSTAMIWYDNE
jgi:WD40 repeat protein